MRLPKGPLAAATLVAALVVLDVVLVAAAVTHRASPAAAPMAPVGLPSEAASLPASQSASQPASPAAPVEPMRAAPLDVAADGTALRAVSAGSCPAGGARLQWSADRGARWTNIATPARQVLRVQVAGGGVAWLTGADQRCQLQLWNTTDSGRTWTLGDVSGAWSLLTQAAATQLHAPGGLVRSPCARGANAVDLAGLTVASAAMLCSNGNLYSTADGGTTWQPVGTWPLARAVANDPSGQVLILRPGAAGCTGLEVDSAARGSAAGRLACVAQASRDAAAGMAFTSNGSGLIVVGAATYRTDDGGRSWRPA